MNMHNIFYWAGINQEIEKFVASCSICSAYQSVNKKELESLMSHPDPTRPLQYIAMDLCHLRGKNYLVTVGYYSIFVEIDRLYQIIKQREVMHKLKAHMARHGIHERVVNDNGRQYNSDEFHIFANMYELEHVTYSPGAGCIKKVIKVNHS
jgi:hypothetical protein